MSKPTRVSDLSKLAVLFLIPATLFCASVPVPAWVTPQISIPKSLQTRDVQGIAERIVNGKLTLKVDSFLELVLKNSTDVNISRMDVYTAADQIQAARAVFDPAVELGFNTFRSVTPQTSQIGGASTLSSLTENSFINYQQLFPTGQTATASFNAYAQFQQQRVQHF